MPKLVLPTSAKKSVSSSASLIDLSQVPLSASVRSAPMPAVLGPRNDCKL